jgi:hypothetical protein
MPTTVFRYTNQFIGYGDGERVDFQLGDGLYPTVVNNVYLDNVETLMFTANGFGLITLATAPASYVHVSATGVEAT